uniref:Protein wntless n=1 Tax=Heterorhabditis bacteriophora TaxID=37862 RepID=A0A1I7XQ75_HETBA
MNPKSANCQIGMISSLHIIAIHQNGGFTLVWIWLKTLLSPTVIAAIAWYWDRVRRLARKPLLLEKSIMTLGISLAMLDFLLNGYLCFGKLYQYLFVVPIEWASLIYRVPFMLLLGDIRQGVFYCVLFAFWLIFAGEHLIDDTTRNNIVSYRFNLFFIILASSALLAYDMCERGIQLYNPFYSIWSSETGTMFAYISIYLASFCTMVYFVFLFYKIWKVWTTIKRKRAAQLYKTCENRRLKVEAIIYRFKFLMLFTLVCAGLTISSYIMKQVGSYSCIGYGEAQIHSDDPDDSVLIRNTSAFFTGTFGMWNIYVLLLLAMYAPSHKQYAGSTELVDENEGLMGGTTESNVMTTFLKSATD